MAPNGQVTPEMEAILRIIARENLVLSTGHVHPEEVIAVVRRGRELGVKEHAHHPQLHHRAGVDHGAGQGGHRHGRADRGLLPPVPGRTERAAALPHALDADQRQARGAGGEGAGRPRAW